MIFSKFNDNIKRQLSGPDWLIHENRWDDERQSFYETIFTLGNGKMGTRAVLEEIPKGASPGTFAAGIYDSMGAQVTELVNLPNPMNFRIIANGEKLGVDTMDVKEHMRVLDLKSGILARRTLYNSTYCGRLDYQSMRFLSMDNIGLGVIEIYLTPLDKTVDISFESSIDISVTNKGLLTEGQKKHFHVIDFDKKSSLNYIQVTTFEKEINVGYGSVLKYAISKTCRVVPRRVFKLKIQKGKTVCLTKYFYITNSMDVSSKALKSYVVKRLRKASRKKVQQLISETKDAWQKRWNISDILIKGDAAVQRALRFNLYHMIICGSENGGRSSIGARTLSGEGYRGHIFWDTEIFLLPFYIYNYPEIAKSLLLYRYNRLDAALKIANERGYKGALYPWESADRGQECTPSWVKDADGRIIKIATALREHHIVADVAYAVHQFIRVTNDIDFALKYGLEMMLYSAMFWISRLDYDKKTGTYAINNIIGPDEFHEDVNNNAYTNSMAKWNIIRTCEYVKSLKAKYPQDVRQVLSKLNILDRDLKRWMRTTFKIRHAYPYREGIIEAFDGYFKKQKVPVMHAKGALQMPVPRFRVVDKDKTQLVKQADVVMLLYLLSDKFSMKSKRLNYRFYLERTIHESSLSSSIHSIVGSDVGDRLRAYRFFLLALNTDLGNVHKNSDDGIHAACLGGVWQAVINGFAGMRFVRNMFYFEPKIPAHWQSMEFNIKREGIILNVLIDRKTIRFYFESQKKDRKIVLNVFGDLQVIKANESRSFKRRDNVMKVKDIMHKRVVTLSGSMDVQSIAKVLTTKKITGAPVVDKKGCLIGFLSERDMMKAACDIKNFRKKKAENIMTRKIYTVQPEMAVERIAQVFDRRNYRTIPVVKKDKIVGIIKRSDIIDRILGEYY